VTPFTYFPNAAFVQSYLSGFAFWLFVAAAVLMLIPLVLVTVWAASVRAELRRAAQQPAVQPAANLPAWPGGIGLPRLSS